MKKVLLSFLLFLVGINYSTAQDDPFAQSDPFAVSSSQDAAALSPNELPSFKEYIASPENIPVDLISVSELERVKKASLERINFLDARTKKEYKVSHLKNAKHCGFETFSIERVWMVNRTARVIIYSSTLERSKLLAQYLIMMGFKDIQVLKGGIIAWKNANKDVYDATNVVTDKVHVGDKENMKILKEGKGIHF